MSFIDDLMGRTAADSSRNAAAGVAAGYTNAAGINAAANTQAGNILSGAATGAASDQYGKEQNAITQLLGYGNQYAQQFRDTANLYQPYASAGGDALAQLRNGLGLNGAGGSQAFTDAYRAAPGYQAALQTGSNAITGNAAARGMLNSGATLKALDRYGANFEDQRSGDYLTRLMGLTGVGQQATGAMAGLDTAGLQGQLGTRTSAYGGDMNSARTIAGGITGAGNATAGGVLGSANATAGGVLGAANAIGQGEVAAGNAMTQGTQNIFNTGANLLGKGIAAFNPLKGLMG